MLRRVNFETSGRQAERPTSIEHIAARSNEFALWRECQGLFHEGGVATLVSTSIDCADERVIQGDDVQIAVEEADGRSWGTTVSGMPALNSAP